MKYEVYSRGKKYHTNALVLPSVNIIKGKNAKVCDSSVIFNFFRELGRAEFQQDKVECMKYCGKLRLKA